MSTLGTLVANISRKAGDSTIGEYFTEQEIKQAVGDSYRYYVGIMVQLGAGYFETTTNLDIVANVETVDLSALTPPFWTVSLLERYVTNGRIPLKPFERRLRANTTLSTGAGDAYRPTYKIRGQNLVLEPYPLFSETSALKLDYVYQPTFPTSASADSFTFDADFPTIYENLIELRSTIKILETKDAIGGVSDINTFRVELAEIQEAFIETISPDENADRIEYVGIDYSVLY